jgi:hypothetical protein
LSVAFDITKNPFHLLGVSMRARMPEIAEAYEDALADGHAPEQVLLDAQKRLCTPKSRLDAELAWLHGLAPARAAELVAALQHGDLAAAGSALDTLVGLDRANLAADLCARVPGATRYVEALLESYADLDIQSLQRNIASSRVVAGFLPPDDDLITKALDRLCDLHAGAAFACIAGSDRPGVALTGIVEAFQEDAERSVLRLLDLIVGKHDVSSSPHLGRIKEEIEEIIACCRDQNGPLDVDMLQRLLAEWDEIGQAVQLRMEAKSLEEPRSRDLCNLVRDFCLWLANEEQRYAEALAISRALLATFPELPLTADRLREDVETLESLAASAAMARHMQPLIKARESAERDLKRLNADLLNGGFGPNSRGLARSLFDAFMGAARGTGGTTEAELPWFLVRDLAIDLNNEHELPEAARDLLAGLIKVAAMAPSPAIIKKLELDHRTIDRNLKWRDLHAARGDAARALSIVSQLLPGADSKERDTLLSIKAGIENAKATEKRPRLFWAIATAVAVFAIFASIAADRAPRDQRRSTTPPPPTVSPRITTQPTATATPRTTTQPAPSTSPPPVPAPPAAALEEMPAIGYDRVLSKNEVRYCVFQGERLDLLRELTGTNTEVDLFNALVRDFNERCSSFRYRQGVLQSVERELPGQRTALRRDAASIAAQWRVPATPPATTGMTVAVDRLIDIQTKAGATRVQQRLKALGFYDGKADGLWGPRSRNALRGFKRSAGFADDPNWDLATQRALWDE